MIKYFTTVFHIFIIKATIDKFMEYIPPCKDCIVQSMCLKTDNDNTNKPFIITRKCSILRRYLEQNKYFVIIKKRGYLMNNDGYEICKKYKGKKEHIIKFKYKGKEFHYYEKCGYCFATGKIDWIEKARGRQPGIFGCFIDSHPAGSLILDMGDNLVYDGHDYIKTNTERGTALWNELVTKQNESYNEEDEK